MRLLALVGVAAVLAVACGGGDGDDSGRAAPGNTNAPAGQGQASSALEACALVTKEEAESLLGSAIGDTQKGPVGPFQSCGYYATSGIFNFVQVQVCRCLSGSQFDSSTRSGAEALGVTAKPVSGVGDKAYWLEGILWVQKGSYAINLWLSTQALTTEGGQPLEGAALERKALGKHVEVAQKALSRLP